MTGQDPVTTRAWVDPAPVRALAALFDDAITAPEPGEALPPLWHWAALANWAPAGLTGPDGHPRVGGFLPDVGKPRRMFAGGSVEFHAPLLVGDQVERQDAVLSVTPKSGRQGDFVLVQVQTLVFNPAGELALTETQDLIYRDEAPARPTASEHPPVAAAPIHPALLTRNQRGEWALATDPVKLMRFSAATSNAHRIHYDWPYATQVEGYPALVVHGPLQTLAMAEVLRLESISSISKITHRGTKPLFCGDPALITTTSTNAHHLDLTLTSSTGTHSTLSVQPSW